MEKKISRLIQEIEKDSESGASQLIIKALNIYKNFCKIKNNHNRSFESEINEISHAIINSRPSMASLINLVGYVVSKLEKYTCSELTELLDDFESYYDQIQQKIFENFTGFLQKTKNHPFSLMLISYSSTINNLLLKEKFKDLEVYVLESRPLFEGVKTAELLSDKYRVHLIIDAAMGYFMDKIDVVLIGVDSILRDGSIINKIGTYPLTTISKFNKKPVYVVGTSFKYNLRSHYELGVKITQKNENQIIDKPHIFSKLQIHNYYFDISPPENITGIISEYGVLSMDDFLNRIRDEIPISWYKKFC